MTVKPAENTAEIFWGDSENVLPTRTVKDKISLIGKNFRNCFDTRFSKPGEGREKIPGRFAELSSKRPSDGVAEKLFCSHCQFSVKAVLRKVAVSSNEKILEFIFGAAIRDTVPL